MRTCGTCSLLLKQQALPPRIPVLAQCCYIATKNVHSASAHVLNRLRPDPNIANTGTPQPSHPCWHSALGWRCARCTSTLGRLAPASPTPHVQAPYTFVGGLLHFKPTKAQVRTACTNPTTTSAPMHRHSRTLLTSLWCTAATAATKMFQVHVRTCRIGTLIPETMRMHPPHRCWCTAAPRKSCHACAHLQYMP